MSRTTLRGRAGAALVASAVTVSLVLAGGTAQAAPADRGVDWLAGQLDNGVIANGGFADYGLSIDTAFAMKAVGGHGADVQQVRDAIELNLGDYIAGDSFGDPDSTYAGPTAKSIVMAQTTGADPRDFGGVDLVKRLNGVVHKSGPAKGRIVDVSTFGDFANTLGQILATRGLAEAGSGQAGAVRKFLLQQQCRQGFFRLNFAKLKSDHQGCRKSSPADPDATSYAVVQLWKTSKGHPGFRAALKRAVAWLVDQQRKSGAFIGGTTTAIPNTNSTGLAGWALATSGKCGAARKAASWVAKLQVGPQSGGSTLAGERGAIAYDAKAMKDGKQDGITDGTRGQWERSTSQAAPALQFLHGC
jgi:hypothetical protein